MLYKATLFYLEQKIYLNTIPKFNLLFTLASY